MRILYGILNWGLGHATRSVPVIESLKTLGHEVVIASDGLALQWIRQRFPELHTVEVPGLQPVYPENDNMVWAMARQLPAFLKTLKKENQACIDWANQLRADRIISDNRYAFYHPQLPSAILCHQLQLRMPAGSGWITPFIQAYNHRTLQRFSDIWVPDFPDHRLSGKLSEWNHPKVKFIGPLSHLPKNNSTEREKKQYLFLLSGPEPQRSLLEKKILRWGKLPAKQSTLVRGTADQRKFPLPLGLEVIDLANSATIAELLKSHETVICRPGYSTLMDLQGSGLNALLIPTPGQTEQEYLAQQLQQQDIAYSVAQHELNWEDHLPQAAKRKGFTSLPEKCTLLQATLTEWLKP